MCRPTHFAGISGVTVRSVGTTGGESDASSLLSRSAPEANTEPLLEVTDLRTHFLTPRGRVRAVDGVSLTLARGTTLGVVGESGSGKTILSRSIMNLLPRENVARSGRVMFMGRD